MDFTNQEPEKWLDFVRYFSKAFGYGQQISFQDDSAHLEIKPVPLSENGPRVIICSPHPDDECLTGALPIRLLTEANASVVNLAITLGSAIARKEGRLKELTDACNLVGFNNRLVLQPLGFSQVSLAERQDYPQEWLEKVKIIAAHFQEINPDLLCVPHPKDGHPTHEAVSLLVSEAICFYSEQENKRVIVAESEFWRPSISPKIMVGLDDDDLSLLVAGVAKHHGEIARNPYHLRMPARLMDNVRRGGELICGRGEAPPDFCFGELYDLCLYDNGKRRPWPKKKMIFPPGTKIDLLDRL